MPCQRCSELPVQCIPFLRHWPGTRCEQCIQDNCACGPNRGLFIETRVDGNGTLQIPPEILAMLNSLQSSASEDSDTSRYFQGLADIHWDLTCLGHGVARLGNMSQRVVAIALGVLRQAFWPSDMVVYRIWERENYIRLYQRFKDLAESAPLANLEWATSAAIAEIDREQYPPGLRRQHTQISQPERFEAYRIIIERGRRWARISEAATCLEPILLDERCYIGHSNNIIGPIIDNGADEEFESFLKYLMAPQRGFKEECLRLSGLVRMITTLADCPDGSEVRNYLANEIRSRLQKVSPPAPGTGNRSGREKRLIPFRTDRQKAAIIDIFGASIRIEQPGTGGQEWGQYAAKRAESDRNPGIADISQTPTVRAESRLSMSSGYSSEDPLQPGDLELWEYAD